MAKFEGFFDAFLSVFSCFLVSAGSICMIEAGKKWLFSGFSVVRPKSKPSATRCSILRLSGGKKFRQTDAKVDTSVAYRFILLLTSMKRPKIAGRVSKRGHF